MPTVIFEIAITGDKKVAEEIARVRADLKGDRFIEPWERVVEMVATSARGYVPHWHGRLLASIEEEVFQKEDETIGVIYSDEFYAPPLERGTKPYFPNFEALEEWAEDHDTTTWIVAMAILTRGVLPLEFFKKSLVENADEAFQMIGEAVGQIIEGGY